jgi:hypothetical protein
VKDSKSHPPIVNAKARSSVAILMKSKRDEVATINIMQAQDEELYFIFNLEYRCVALSIGISYGLSIKSQCSI